MKLVVQVLVGAFLLLAVGNKVAEAAGARRCHCAANCWCRRPVISLFRWVLPWHKNSVEEHPEHSMTVRP